MRYASAVNVQIYDWRCVTERKCDRGRRCVGESEQEKEERSVREKERVCLWGRRERKREWTIKCIGERRDFRQTDRQTDRLVCSLLEKVSKRKRKDVLERKKDYAYRVGREESVKDQLYWRKKGFQRKRERESGDWGRLRKIGIKKERVRERSGVLERRVF